MINDLKDLQKLLKLCRSQGITEIKLQGVEIRFGDMPQVHNSQSVNNISEELVNPYANFPQEVLTPEQLMFYSAGGLPEEDPENKEAI
jgi:hypothetical protein